MLVKGAHGIQSKGVFGALYYTKYAHSIIFICFGLVLLLFICFYLFLHKLQGPFSGTWVSICDDYSSPIEMTLKFHNKIEHIAMMSHDQHGIPNYLQLHWLLYINRRSVLLARGNIGVCVCDGFHSQRTSNVENVSMWWYHHERTNTLCALAGVNWLLK